MKGNELPDNCSFRKSRLERAGPLVGCQRGRAHPPRTAESSRQGSFLAERLDAQLERRLRPQSSRWGFSLRRPTGPIRRPAHSLVERASFGTTSRTAACLRAATVQRLRSTARHWPPLSAGPRKLGRLSRRRFTPASCATRRGACLPDVKRGPQVPQHRSPGGHRDLPFA